MTDLEFEKITIMILEYIKDNNLLPLVQKDKTGFNILDFDDIFDIHGEQSTMLVETEDILDFFKFDISENYICTMDFRLQNYIELLILVRQKIVELEKNK